MSSITTPPPPLPVAGQIPWDVPLNACLVWLYENLVRVDATASDNAGKVPDGGLTGDVLTKQSDTDQDTIWAAGGVSPAMLAYRHVQSAPADVWTITHPLSFQPGVLAVDSARREIWPGDVLYLSDTTIQLNFSSAVGGEAYLS